MKWFSSTEALLAGLGSMVLAFCCGPTQAQTVVLRDGLDDATGGNLHVIATGTDFDNSQVNRTTIPAFQGTAAVDVRFGFDYANGLVGETFSPPLGAAPGPYFASIPEAPNTQPGDAPRKGLYLAANTFVIGGGIADVSALPLDPTANPALPKIDRLLRVSGDYDVQVDVWANFEIGSASTTEFVGLMLGQDGVRPGRAAGGGFAYSLDAGAANDYRLLKAEPTNANFFNSNYARQVLDGPADPTTPSDSPLFDQQYNPEILKTYLVDPQFDVIGAANDNENDFWQDAFSTRDYGIAQSPDAATDTSVFPFVAIGQGGTQTGQPSGGNPPGDLGFRWATIRMEVRPDEQGYGFGRPEARFRDELGVARVYLQAAWQGINEAGEPLVDEMGNPITITSPELFVGVIDNSIAQGRDVDPVTEVVDFSDPVALLHFDAFSSVNSGGFTFSIFDNLIITSLATTVGLPGDYNSDSVVDAADYTVWRDNLGTAFALPNRGAGITGNVAQADYNTWKNNFGATSPGIAAAGAVPEPSACLIACLGLAALRASGVQLRGRRRTLTA